MTLDLSKVSDTYFNKLFVAKNNTALSSGIKAKVLLVDKFTTPIISMCYTQSNLLQQDVILVEMLENLHNLHTMKHLNCIVYIKPVKESIVFLMNELRSPHFNNYQLFFNNTIHKNQLEKIADADEFELVNEVVELFQDYFIVNTNLFTVALPSPDITVKASNLVVEEANSLSSLLLSLRKCPVIKFESNSLELRKLSSEILYNINSNSNNNLYDDLNKKSDTPPVLLLLDRKNDPITPLLTPWTYQSMLHELIGIKKNIVEIQESKEQVLLSESQDSFYKESIYLNYGDLTDKFQKYVEDYKKQTKLSSIENLKTQNLTELKKLLTRFPEFKKLSNNILKHLNLISELDKQISQQNLWVVGELQQTIICNLENHSTIKTKILELLNDRSITTEHKVKIILLYMTKFPEHSGEVSQFVGKLNDPSFTSPVPTVSQMSLLEHFNKLFGAKVYKTTPDNSNNIGSIFNKNKISINSLFSNSNNNSNNTPKNDNIYMQYIPKLNEILNALINQHQPKQPNSNTSNPLADLSTLVPDTVADQYGNVSNAIVQDIIVYFKGGVTYEESRLVHDLAASNPRINLVVGSDRILNSSLWMNKLYDIVNEDYNSGDSGMSASQTRTSQLRDIL